MKTKKDKYVDKVYRLKRDAAPLSFMLPTRHTRRFPLLHFDDSTGENRALRYARNQKTPFEDEQDGNVILEPVIFEDGMLRVKKENQVLQHFLYIHPMNNKIFEEMDPEKDAAEELEFLEYEAEALSKAKGLTIKKLESIAKVLFGINTDNFTTSELKRDILVFAKREPMDFLESINDPELEHNSNVHRLFELSLLKFRNKKKEVWYNTPTNKTKMLSVPHGEDPYDIVAGFLKTDDGIDQLKVLEGLLNE
jgi:hypothetical protein